MPREETSAEKMLGAPRGTMCLFYFAVSDAQADGNVLIFVLQLFWVHTTELQAEGRLQSVAPCVYHARLAQCVWDLTWV